MSTRILVTSAGGKVEWATNLIDRAVDNGVTRIVRLSVRVADMTPSSRLSR